MLGRNASLLLALPGVVFHELAHYIFCQLAGARVHKVVYFSLGNPAGYVVHAAPRHFREHFAIVVGPFIFNSSISFLLFASVASKWARPFIIDNAQPHTLILAVLALWLGASLASQAFPSGGDGRNLWQAANRHLRRGNMLAVAGYPIVGLIYLLNILRRFGLNWLYAGALLLLSSTL